MLFRGFFAVSKSVSCLGRPSICNTTIHNINKASNIDISIKKKMSMDMGGHGSMNNSFAEDKMGMEEVEKGSIISINEDTEVKDFCWNVYLKSTLIEIMMHKEEMRKSSNEETKVELASSRNGGKQVGLKIINRPLSSPSSSPLSPP